MKKLSVGIIFGGKSAEHEVSLQSAKNIIEAIDRDRFDLVLIGIDKQGQWHLSDANHYLVHADDPQLISFNASERHLALQPGQISQPFIESNNAQQLSQIDVILPIIHGTLGEDGSLQGLLEFVDRPYVGSSVLGSSICMDKDVTKRLLMHAGIAVAPYFAIKAAAVKSAADEEALYHQAVAKLGLPLFIKPASQGSSVGVSKVSDLNAFSTAIKLAFNYDHKVLIEQAIVGREIECAILGNEQPRASVCGEVLTQDQFYSYQAKYIDGQSKAVIPAELSADAEANIQAIALKTFMALECSGLARVDVFLTPNNEVVVNEVNTLPGFTNISMYPQLWQASGLSYRDLISTLIDLAIERYQSQASKQHYIDLSAFEKAKN
ncbi:D-alanine-D-alanine ligase [Acinetobacter calcoaceticus]|uniref:D-alanine--D-alanine ligase n=1 Tax=Acinetobacter calcoaceticus TaxID=471 RepID=A0A4R1Y4Z1_ACICA|nr:D-alanine-D-alanine ligase [Acinetobacter calcoaceticus]